MIYADEDRSLVRYCTNTFASISLAFFLLLFFLGILLKKYEDWKRGQGRGYTRRHYIFFSFVFVILSHERFMLELDYGGWRVRAVDLFLVFLFTFYFFYFLWLII